nr:MAG TPA: hypothetical protein [Caudoviricetes sp.]
MTGRRRSASERQFSNNSRRARTRERVRTPARDGIECGYLSILPKK